MSPIQLSNQSQALLSGLQNAAGTEQAAATQLASDQAALGTLQNQVLSAQSAVQADQAALAAATTSTTAAFTALCQQLAADMGVPLPITISAAPPPAAPPAPPAS
jgi:hypothetical protein